MKKLLISLAGILCSVAALADTRCIGWLDVSDVSQYVYNGSHWIEQGYFAKGASLYGDVDCPMASIPKALAGADWIQTSAFSRKCTLGKLARFQAKADCDVFIAHSEAIVTKPSWLQDWTATGMTLQDDAGHSFAFLSKRFKKDETVCLGPNGDADKPMYIVVVKPLKKLPAKARPAGFCIDVRSLGAVPDGRTVNTAAIQQAIDECSARPGGGTVLVDGGIFVSGTLELKSGVTLRIEEGSILRASAEHGDFPPHRVDLPSFRGKEDFQFIFAYKAKDIAITGGGILDGYSIREGFPWRGRNNEWERPRLIRMFECENIRVDGVSLIRSANWTQYYEACRNLTLNHLNIRCYTGTNNQDGMDISGCTNVVIRDILGFCGDDVVCLKALSMVPATNIYVEKVRSRYANCNIVKIGTETHGDIRNVQVKDVEGWTRYSIAIEAVDGSNIDGVIYEDIRLHHCASPFVVRLGNRGRTFEGGPNPAPTGSIRNVVLRRIRNDDIGWVERKTGPGVAACIAGIPGHKISNVLVEDCDILLYGSINDEQYIFGDVPENEAKYPEFDCCGITPAYGMYIRHADGVTLRNVRIRMKNHDVRPAVVLEDAEGWKFEGLQYEVLPVTRPFPLWHKTYGEVK